MLMCISLGASAVVTCKATTQKGTQCTRVARKTVTALSIIICIIVESPLMVLSAKRQQSQVIDALVKP